jgi:4'-phosphopantetheinyl transferase
MNDRLAPAPLDVWLLHVPSLASDLRDRCAAELSPPERARAAHYRQPQDVANYEVGHGLARLLSARRAGRTPDSLTWAVGPAGKPFWKEIDLPFNVSHSGPWLALVLGNVGDVGIDLQCDDWCLDVDKIAGFAFSQDEREHLAACRAAARRSTFFTLWVLREAGSKASGRGILDITRKVSALPMPGPEAWILAQGLIEPVWTRILPAPEGCFAAIAVRSVAHPPAPIVQRRVLAELVPDVAV